MEKVKAVGISLRPYKGNFFFASTREQYEAAHIQIFGHEDKLNAGQSGRFTVGPDKANMRTFLIWADDAASLVHEVAHVALELFNVMNTDPCDEASEPFCYLLQQIFEDCAKHLTAKRPAKKKKP